jgi:hypothetical protein
MQQAIALTQPAPGKSCGGCTLCCKVLKITALSKPHGTWCTHCQPGVGCRVYDDRPEECRTFLCGWLVNSQLGPEWKPDKSRLIITNAADGNGLAIRCDPGYPNAWRKEPYRSQILQWAKAAKPQDGPIVVAIGNRLTVIAPEGEFPLGEFGEGDQIFREFSGGRLVGVRVVRASEFSAGREAYPKSSDRVIEDKLWSYGGI